MKLICRRTTFIPLAALVRAPTRWHRAVLLMGLYDPALLVAAERTQPGSVVPSRPGLGPDELAAYFAAQQRLSLGDITAPLLIVHGEADHVIPVEHARDLAAQAHQLGLSAQLVTVPGLAHDSDHEGEEWTALWPRITDFLEKE
jgi:pimeloyl-ACP methyl ester carboxylesterase